ncbi:MAG TPA: hypothetical protein VJ851_15875 [Jatrophihabitans sp.]|nr:hypothetical protein [Jatrophihabitans sp.]
MRKSWALLLTPVLVMFFLILGNPSANAFGAEMLGCSVDSAAWTAKACSGGGSDSSGPHVIHYAAQNLSGSYSMNWTPHNGFGQVITASCGSGTVINCIWSGCTASSTTCDIGAGQFLQDKSFVATVELTQSGQTRSISANAVIYGTPGCRTISGCS